MDVDFPIQDTLLLATSDSDILQEILNFSAHGTMSITGLLII